MSAALCSICAAPALAQPAPDQPAPSKAGSTPGETALPGTDPAVANQNRPAIAGGQDIVVTGSRIARQSFNTPNPVFAIDASTIQASGKTDLTTLLSDYPALIASQGPTQTAGDADPGSARQASTCSICAISARSELSC